MKIGDILYDWFLIEEIRPDDLLPDIFVRLIGKNIHTGEKVELGLEKRLLK